MPQQSSIKKLEPEVRDAIAEKLQECASLNEILDMLEQEFGVVVSRSALGRHAKHYRKTVETLNNSREFARQLALDLGEKEGDQSFDLMTEMMSHLMFKALESQTVEDVKKAFNTGDFMKMAVAMKTLAEAKVKDINYKREVRIEVAKEAAAIAGDAMKEAGASAKGIKFAQEKILGLVRPEGG